MKITKLVRREAKKLFRACTVNGLLDENRARQAVDQLLELRPRSYVAILSHFQRLVKLDAQRHLARVESTVPLTTSAEADIKAGLTRRYGPGLNFRFSQNAGLLGGVRVQVGSDVYDGTIKARLEEVRHSFETA